MSTFVPIPTAHSVKILHVASRLSNETGGPADYIAGLCTALTRAGCHTTLAMLGDDIADGIMISQSYGVQVCLYRPTLDRSLYSIEMSRKLPSLICAADIIHIHGLWEYPNWLSGHLARKFHKPMIISLYGVLHPRFLAKSSWKKRLAAVLFANGHLHAAACLHATDALEAEGVRGFGLNVPVAIIPNGIDCASFSARKVGKSFYDRFPTCYRKRILLFLSRINEGKGLMELVQCWGQLAEFFPDWQLVIAGPDEQGYINLVEQAADRCHVVERTTYLGPLYGEEKIAAFADAHLFVLPTHGDNFGIVIAEALAGGTPVITTQAAPWEGLVTHRCGWWVPVGIPSLLRALTTAFLLPPEELCRMGERGRSWIQQELSWDAIAHQMLDVYLWSMGDAPQPPSISQTSSTNHAIAT